MCKMIWRFVGEVLQRLKITTTFTFQDIKRGSAKGAMDKEKKKKQLERLKEQLTKLEIQETDKDENKTIALGTSKLNYLDPRISVAW